jgi:hypothetical protein
MASAGAPWSCNEEEECCFGGDLHHRLVRRFVEEAAKREAVGVGVEDPELARIAAEDAALAQRNALAALEIIKMQMMHLRSRGEGLGTESEQELAVVADAPEGGSSGEGNDLYQDRKVEAGAPDMGSRWVTRVWGIGEGCACACMWGGRSGGAASMQSSSTCGHTRTVIIIPIRIKTPSHPPTHTPQAYYVQSARTLPS